MLQDAPAEAAGQPPVERQAEAGAPALEVLLQLPAHGIEVRRRLDHARGDPLAQLEQHLAGVVVAAERDPHEPALCGGHEHRARPASPGSCRRRPAARRLRPARRAGRPRRRPRSRRPPAPLATGPSPTSSSIPCEPQLLQSFVEVAAGRVLGAPEHSPDLVMRQVAREAQHHRGALLAGQLPDLRPQAWSGPAELSAARSGTSATGSGRRPFARWESSAFRCAIVSTQARRLELRRRRGYARIADRNVSWKQSSASWRPTDATRNL